MTADTSRRIPSSIDAITALSFNVNLNVNYLLKKNVYFKRKIYKPDS